MAEKIKGQVKFWPAHHTAAVNHIFQPSNINTARYTAHTVLPVMLISQTPPALHSPATGLVATAPWCWKFRRWTSHHDNRRVMKKKKPKHCGHEIALTVGLISGQAGVCFNSKLFSGLSLWGFTRPCPPSWSWLGTHPSTICLLHLTSQPAPSLFSFFFFTHFIPHLCLFHSTLHPPAPSHFHQEMFLYTFYFIFFPIGCEHINLQFNYGTAVGWFGLHPRLTFTRFPWRKELHFHLSAVVMMSESSGGGEEWSYLCCVNLTKNALEHDLLCMYHLLLGVLFKKAFFFNIIPWKYFPSNRKRDITSSSISLFVTFYELIIQTYESSTSCIVLLCNREGQSKPLTLPKFRREVLHTAFCIKYMQSSLLEASFNGLKRKYQHIKQAVWKREKL